MFNLDIYNFIDYYKSVKKFPFYISFTPLRYKIYYKIYDTMYYYIQN